MKIFVAGSTGDVGLPTVRRLVERGHEVVAMTRSPSKTRRLERLGASPTVADALRGDQVRQAMAEAAPEAVVDMLTALPRTGPTRPSHLAATNTLRERGTANMLAGAESAGVRRYVSESIIFAYGYGDRGDRPLTEDDPPGPLEATPPSLRPALRTLNAKERSVLAAPMDGAVLRFGVFYGPGAGSTTFLARMLKRRMLALPSGPLGVTPWIHVEDAAAAVVDAVEGPATGLFNVVDDESTTFRRFADELAHRLGVRPPYRVPAWLVRPFVPYAAVFMTRTRVVASNGRARGELGWEPRFPTYREGLAQVAAALGRAGRPDSTDA